ncbi:MAG: iron-sulfur cluster insertion protein ErpA [Chloroflexi bacterium]|nr:iron-sulfur cluster insertion protein ErpA [Chloroflexota bacterium]
MITEQTKPIALTEAATTQLKRLIASQPTPDVALRVFVSPGGCSGFQYGMALDSEVQEGDLVIEQDGIRVVVDDFSLNHIQGSEIDYVDGLMGAGFTVYNPNAVSSCGCGHSFDTAEHGGDAQRCH